MLLPRTRGDLAQTVALAATYALAGVVTLSLPETVLELRRMIWPASGIALAWLMLGGLRLWPGVLVGAALATALTGGPALHVAGTGIANAAEIVLAVWLLRKAGLRRLIESRRELLVFLGVIVGSTALSAFVSVGSLIAAGGLSAASGSQVWLNWWLTHAMGQVVFTPLILSLPWFAGPPPRLPWRESVMMTVGLGLTLVATFTTVAPAPLRSQPLAFLSFPFLFWAAYRYGPFGASASSFVAAAFAVTGTLLGMGPFVHASPNTSLALTLLFVAAVSFSTLFVSGLVSERRRAERAREELERRVHRSEKLESLGALAGGIAHDFNNLLVAIRGHVDLVLMDADEADPAYRHLTRSVRASERAAELCRKLLAYAGQGPYEHAVVDLRPVVEEMAAPLRTSLPDGARLACAPGHDVIPVRGDVRQLRQVLQNLVSNAGEALRDGGRILIRTRATTSEEEAEEEGTLFLEPPTGPLALLSVEDDGEGIRPEHVERLFEPVFSTRGPGRGLGLAAVLGVMRSHGGAIRVRSAPGEGSRFSLLFPRAAPPLQSVPAPPIEAPRRSQGKALIVEDEEAVRHAASLLVNRLGYETVAVSDGGAALRMLQERGDEFEWVLLDQTMPGMDGMETLRRMRRAGRTLPVLLSSGYVLRPVEVTAELGPTRFLAKPYTLAALRTAVDGLLGVEAVERSDGTESEPSSPSSPGGRRGSTSRSRT